MHQSLELPPDASEALVLLQERSKSHKVLVFKKSWMCGMSAAAEDALQRYLKERTSSVPVEIAVVDVLKERPLARGLTTLLRIRHESPQALLFESGALRWHSSHGDLTTERFAAELDGQVRTR